MKVFSPFRLDVVNQCLWHGETRLTLVENAAQYVRAAKPLGELRPGLNGQPLFARATGSPANQMRIDSSLAASGNPNPHLHAFEQVYFVKEATMTLRR